MTTIETTPQISLKGVHSVIAIEQTQNVTEGWVLRDSGREDSKSQWKMGIA